MLALSSSAFNSLKIRKCICQQTVRSIKRLTSQLPRKISRLADYSYAVKSACRIFGMDKTLSNSLLSMDGIQNIGSLRSKLISNVNRRMLSTKRPFETQKNLSHDVLVYSHKNDTFYTMLSYFGLFQAAVWGYMAFFAVQYLKSTPITLKDTTDLPWWKRLLYKEGQYRNALSMLCLFVGAIVLFITMTYPRRVVRDLWLLKGGEIVRISTYTWFGKTQNLTKPVEHLDCLQSRTGSGHHIPVKIKGKNFYYLLDKQGAFHNTELFDFVIGMKRNLK